MSQQKRVTKRAIVASLLSLSICSSMLIGTTYAWFTDSVTSSGNIIKSGTLQVELNWKDGDEAPDNTTEWKDAETETIFGYDLWEPGYTQVRHLQVVNNGTLALKYRFTILPTGELDPATADLAEVIDVYFKNPAVTVADRSEVETKLEKIGTLREVLSDTSILSVATEGHLAAGESAPTTNEVTIALKMQEGAGNKYQGLEVNGGFAVKLYATQDTVESDSFDKMYDEQAAYDHNDDDPAVTVKDDPTDVTIGIPAGVASPVDTYKVVVNDYETATNAEGTTTLSMDISLERNGIVVTDFDGTTQYSVKVFVGKGLMVDAVYHNELKVEPFTYDAVTGYISFTTTSFSPFSVVYHEPQTLTFDKNDANATGTMEAQNIYAGVKAAISVNQFSKVGYTFTGWKDSEGNDYHDGEEYSFADSTTLYAQWAPNDYPLQYWKNIAAGETVYIQTNFTFDQPFTVAACTATKTGYDFVNWNTAADGSGDSYNAGDTATLSKADTVALYAQWQAKDYDVTFDANGGTGTMTAQTITFDATANLTANAFTKTGYTFAGWATAADEPYTYEDKAPYTMETEGATLYAKWSANPYEVTFNANGGTGTMDNQTIYYDASADLTPNAFTRTGYTFKGWNTKADGTGTSYADNASYTMASTEIVTLYAQWQANNYDVTFDANGGTGTMSAQTITFDATAALKENAFTRTGYTFKGWNTKADGTGTSYADKASYTMATEGVTLYAQWEEIKPESITLNETSKTIMTNETLQLTATVAPDTALDTSVSWSSSDTAVATVDTNGKVTPVKYGTVTITATCNGDTNVKATCAVTVLVPVQYRDYDQSTGTFTTKTVGVIPMTASTTTLNGSGYSNGWYAVTDDVTINRINVSGTVNLILVDGKTLTGNQGIRVGGGNTLNIYAQSDGDNQGVLQATGTGNNAGIGGNAYQSGGTIIINGGKVTAQGGSVAAGIGGGGLGDNGKVVINGGIVTATGGNNGAGIGGGQQKTGGEVTINGGTVTATGKAGGAGIGGGALGAGGKVVINGGTVTATGSYANGIGGGYTNSTHGTLTVNNGLKVYKDVNCTNQNTDYANTRTNPMVIK